MLLLGCLTVLGPLAARAAETPPGAPQAIVLITIDTLRADRVSFNGYLPVTTPYLDMLAENGAIFEQAYAPSSWTPPSMASLFTGLYPSSHGIHYGEIADGDEDALGVLQQPRLPSSLETLAERLSAAGYRTIGVHSNLHLSERLGFAQGFDQFAEPGVFPAAPAVNAAVRVELEAAYGAEWRARWKTEKTFLWIHYFDPHDPYFARRPWIERYAPDFSESAESFPAALTLRGIHEKFPDLSGQTRDRLGQLYDSEINFVDDRLRVLGDELGLGDPGLLLVVTSDHGEGLLDHGRVGHGNALFEEEVRVPLLVRWPAGQIGAGRRASRASLLDLLPTLLELSGEAVPSGLAGKSLKSDLLGAEASPPRPLFFEVEPSNPSFLAPLPGSVAVLDGEWKLLRDLEAGARSRLFHLPTDPGETRDLSGAEPQVVRDLERSLKAWREGLPPAPEDLESVPLEDEELRKRLESLGYVGGR